MSRWLPLGVVLAVLVLAPGAVAQAPELVLSAPVAFSPNDDGVKDEARLTVTLSASAVLTVEVLGGDGGVVATVASALDAPAGTTELRWGGALDGGGRARDGLYTVRATAAGEGEETVELRTALRVDTKAPRVVWLRVPERAGRGPVPLRYRISDRAAAVRVTLLLTNQAGERWNGGARSAGVGVVAASWTLRARGGGPVGPGAYRLSLDVADDAGNTGTSATRTLVVTYPVVTRVVRRIDGAGRRVALTFDDCNEGAAWARILDVLASRRLKASFFCLGTEVGEHAALARRTLREGHTVGNHTWNHKLLPSLSAAEVREQLRRSESPWWQLAKASPLPWLRPPYGAVDGTSLAAIGSAGYRHTVLWDVDPQDWRRPGAATIAQRAVGPARAGSIILLHVIAPTAEALPSIVAGLESKGLRPVSLDELVRAGRASSRSSPMPSRGSR
jgi:peptidoglycan/xylan/chitin deacetylase (PgdA/CDA1 family)